MHLLFTPNHVQLLNSCFPPASSLLTAGPDYSPNSHELSRLTYYASNHPGKLTKLGGELEKRIRVECRKAKSGNIRARSSLLISLSILRSLATECRRDIALLSPSLIASVDVTLSSVPNDLEVVARAATVFTAWTTYTNGHLIGADNNFTRNYLSALQQFSSLGCSQASDQEIRNRARLIGFASLTGALNSEALYNDSTQFRAQIAIILRPIMIVLFSMDITILNEQSAVVKEAPASPYLAEFRTRPALERRAASIHVHIDGDKGPSSNDVSVAALRALFSLLSHAGGAHLGYIMQSSFDTLDDFKGWTDLDHCCWYTRKTAEWAQYQYRFVVPTSLVERLLENQDAPTVTPMHLALATMVTTVFSSPTPLINLSSSDLMSNLLTMLLHRTSINAEDALLPPIVDCISSLGYHVYYSDQIQDLAAEMINRLILIEIQGVVGGTDMASAQSRSSAIRHLLAGLMGLIRVANEHEDPKATFTGMQNNPTIVLSPASSLISPGVSDLDKGADERASHRTRISPDIWQDTLSLLCDKDARVRADYADVLIYYITVEMPKHGENLDIDGAKRPNKFAEGPFLQAANINILLSTSDAGSKFLNALHAYIYILATNPTLSSVSSSPSSPSHHSQIPPSGRQTQTDGLDSPFSPTNGRHSVSISQAPRIRKASLVRRLLEKAPSHVRTTIPASAEDYRSIVKILITIQEQLPVRGLFTGIPMLLTLSAAVDAKNREDSEPYIPALQLNGVIARVWLTIAEIWKLSRLVQVCQQAISSAHSAEPFACTALDANNALETLTSCLSVQETIGMGKDDLLKRLSFKWTPEMALRDFVDQASNFDATLRGDNISPLLRISPALMHIENISLQSLTKSTRGLGVTDLREALEGRSSMSNPTLARPPSISTLDHASSMNGGEAVLRLTQTRSRTRARKRTGPTGSVDVREVLTKLGIGKQNNNLLKTSFPAVQRFGNANR